nr:MAG TPA: hypothetical protein [Microviridae sp.]
MITTKICFLSIVYLFHLPKSYTLSICSQLVFEYHYYVFSNFNLRNEIIRMQQHIKSPQIIPYPIPSQFWLHRFSPTTFQKLLISKHLTFLSQMLEAFRF